MTGLDVVLGALIAFGVWRGVRTGALMQIVGTAGWVVGFVVASALMGPVGEAVAASLGVSERTGPVLGFVVVMGAVIALLAFSARVLRKTLEAIKLGALDSAAGAAVGGLRAAFGLSMTLLATSFAPVPGGGPLFVSEEAREASVLYDPVQALAPEVWGIVRTVTPGLQAALADKVNSWQEGEPEAVTGEEPME